MKTSLTPQEIKVTFCTVSSSILLCSTLEVQAGPAEDDTTPWYRQEVPVLTLPATSIIAPYPGHFAASDTRSTRLTTEDAAPSAWEQVYGQTSRLAQTDVLSQGFSFSGSSQLKGPAILTLQSGSGHTQQIGLIGGMTLIPGQQQRAAAQSHPVRPQRRHPQPARPEPRRLLEPDRPTGLARRPVGQRWSGQWLQPQRPGHAPGHRRQCDDPVGRRWLPDWLERELGG